MEEGQVLRCYLAMYINPLFLFAFHLVLVAIVAFTDEVLPLLTSHPAQFRREILLLLEDSESFAVSRSSHTRNFGRV